MPIRTARLVPHRDGFQIIEEDTAWSLWRRRLVAAVERPLGLAVTVAALLCLGAAVVNVGLRDALAAGAAPFDADNRMLRAIREPVPVVERSTPLSEEELEAATIRCGAAPFTARPSEVDDSSGAEATRRSTPTFARRPLVRAAATATLREPAWAIERDLRGRHEEFDVDDGHRRNLVIVLQLGADDSVRRARGGVVELAGLLGPRDRLTIINDFGGAGIILPPTPGGRTAEVERALDCLSVRGDPALGSAVNLADRSARASFIDGAFNRVIIMSDADFKSEARPGPSVRERGRQRGEISSRHVFFSDEHTWGPKSLVWRESWVMAHRNKVLVGEDARTALLESAGYAHLPRPARIVPAEPEHPCVTWRRTPPHKRSKPTHDQTRATSYCP